MKLTFNDMKILCPEIILHWPLHLVLYCTAEPHWDDPSMSIFIYYRWWAYILCIVPVSFFSEIIYCLSHGFGCFQIVNRYNFIKRIFYYDEHYKEWKRRKR